MSIYDRGDIVRVNLNPVSGSEVQGESRPCLVLSVNAFNRLGSMLVAPITQEGNYSRVQGFTVPLMGTGTETQGVVLINGVRMIDLRARPSRKVESAPETLVNEVLAKLQTVIE
ncbi:type II toxin-antitoxin system ChpB family toxin [Endozoicomonas sp. ALC020]|uniref:type II toxin-antitoxin system ChpB family toxin n=1 Tax=unclassified Endozoicomonas TaxID=2644528 RepID=UPI003BB0E435